METLTARKYRRSSQREFILSYLHGSREHPTAMRIFHDLKPLMPTLSLGNLYRNLGILVDQGRIIKITKPGSEEDHFDGNTDMHFHFHCTACGGIFDIPAASYPDLKQLVNAGGDWEVDTCSVSFSGVCPDCRA